MPVRKFRAPPDDESVWLAPDDPRLVPTIASVWDLSRRLCHRQFPPGEHKHRSIESANRATEEWERESVASQRGSERSGSPPK